LDANDKIYYSAYDFNNILANHSKKIGIPSHVIHGILMQGYTAWKRYFKKVSGKPRLKGNRNKLNSVPFPDPFKSPEDNKIGILGLGKVRFHKQDIPEGKIKCGRIIKKASGWYLQLTIDVKNKFSVKETTETIGIDPGFKTLLTLSNGIKIDNPRELRKGEKRIAQAQRGRNKKLTARLQEKQANRRKDRNHKISRSLIEDYQTIFYSNDNFKNLAKINGKSVSEASLGQLIRMITYKGSMCGRDVIPVDSRFTTMTCSVCGSLTGPHGRDGLAVRHWECSACGADHDRDINSAKVVLNAGVGATLKDSEMNQLTGISITNDRKVQIYSLDMMIYTCQKVEI
jgi:transposase